MLRAQARRLTVALQTLDYPPNEVASGIGTYTSALAELLASHGHLVHVISRSTTPVETTECNGPITVHRLGPPRREFPKSMNTVTTLSFGMRILGDEYRYRRRFAQKLTELVEQQQIDLIEAADSGAEAAFYQPERHPHVPFVVRLHGPTALLERFDQNVPEPVRQLIGWYERRFLLKATHLTSPSRAAADLIRQEMSLGDRPIAVYPNPPLDVDSTRVKAPLAEEPNLVLYVGRVTQAKGVTALVRAVPAVLEHCPSARFVFVGPDWPTSTGYGSTQDFLKQLLPRKYHHALSFEGYRPPLEVAQYYRRATLCVFPSRFEVFGYTCLEAMMHGKAIIGSSSGGMADLLEDGRAGLLYDPDGEEELSQQILKLLMDASLRRQLGERAQQRAREHYSAKATLKAVESFYLKAIQDCRAQPKLLKQSPVSELKKSDL
jgi:glycosyltransferase involved in cell wall biosynthesis